MFRGEADFKEIGVNLVFVSWLSRIECCAVKHVRLRMKYYYRNNSKSSFIETQEINYMTISAKKTLTFHRVSLSN